MLEDLLDKLSLYFEKRSDIAFAFLSGSQIKGRATNRSDVDIAIYFYPVVRRPGEFEANGAYAGENEICADIEAIVNKDIARIS